MIDGGKGSGRWGGADDLATTSASGPVAGWSPPRRLVDEPVAAGEPTSPAAWAVRLLRVAGPYRAPAGRKQRVRMGLGQPGARRTPLVLRPAIAALVLIGCGAAASAALGHWPTLVARAYRQLIVSPVPAVAMSPVEPRAHVRRVGARSASADAPGVAPMAEPAIAPGVEAAVASVSAPRVAPPIASHPAPSRLASSTAGAGGRETTGAAHSRRSASPGAAEDTAPVLEAMRALRLDGNPVRARSLLSRYLERHPRGALAEEALAMSIEAAVAHHDADATVLAGKYLARYPAGHFSALASQTLQGAPRP